MRAALPVCALILLAGCATGPSEASRQASSAAMKEYMTCAYARASVLYSQPEAPETIAVAAVEGCGQEDVAAFEAYRAERGAEFALVAMPRLRSQTKESLVGLIVERRAAARRKPAAPPPPAKPIGQQI